MSTRFKTSNLGLVPHHLSSCWCLVAEGILCKIKGSSIETAEGQIPKPTRLPGISDFEDDVDVVYLLPQLPLCLCYVAWIPLHNSLQA